MLKFDDKEDTSATHQPVAFEFWHLHSKVNAENEIGAGGAKALLDMFEENRTITGLGLDGDQTLLQIHIENENEK